MKSSSQAPVWRVLVISFVLFASLIFVSRAAAQDIGTVKNEDGSTTTTVKDTTYGTSGVKSTKTYEGRVTLEQWFGTKRSDEFVSDINPVIREGDGVRLLFKRIETHYLEGGVKEVVTIKFNVKLNDRGYKSPTTYEVVRTDALGGVIYKETYKYDINYHTTEGTLMTVDLESGKKTIKNYNPKTKKFEEAEPPAKEDSKKEPAKTEEPKKETPKEDFPERPAFDAGFELYGGVSYMRAPDETAKNLIGFNTSLFYNVTPHIGVGGEFSGVFGSTTETIGTATFDTSLHRYTMLGGPQFNLNPTDKVNIFIHPLVGMVHDTGTTTFGTTTTSFSANAFAMAFGGGVDVNLNNHFAVRPIQFYYLPTHFGGAWQSNYNISLGLVLKMHNHGRW